MENWISSLAAAATSNSAPGETKIVSKEERKQKRAAKKVRRQQKQQLVERKHPVKKEIQQVAATSSSSQKTTGATHSKRWIKRLGILLRSIQSQHEGEQRYPYCIPDATKRKAKGWNQSSIQPRPMDYSGIGLARDSLYIPFLDPSYFPKLEQEFNEHIPGFFGKTRSKAMKRQMDGNMLWRQLAEKKVQMNKKLKNMTTDERVQAMIDSGMI